jgi:hypothetical protein
MSIDVIDLLPEAHLWATEENGAPTELQQLWAIPYNHSALRGWSSKNY